jgi:hypothetical protein
MTAYEPGMRITYDSASREVIVAFRGHLLRLPGPFSSEDDAIKAGEAYCRSRGWDDKVATPEGHSTVRDRALTS